MVGEATEGALAGRAVFALFPHQTAFRLPEAALIAGAGWACLRRGRCWPPIWRRR